MYVNWTQAPSTMDVVLAVNAAFGHAFGPTWMHASRTKVDWSPSTSMTVSVTVRQHEPVRLLLVALSKP